MPGPSPPAPRQPAPRSSPPPPGNATPEHHSRRTTAPPVMLPRRVDGREHDTADMPMAGFPHKRSPGRVPGSQPAAARSSPSRAAPLAGQRAAGQAPGELPASHRDLAVDQYLAHTGGELVRIGERGAVGDGRGVEYDNVGEVPVAEQATVTQAQGGGGQAAHPADGLRQREQLL